MEQTRANRGSVAVALSADGCLPAMPATGISFVVIIELEVIGLELIGLIGHSRQESGG
jgi:hypothetical protein